MSTALDLTSGVTEFTSRVALKALFGQFGEVTAAWLPPPEHRLTEKSYVKFGSLQAAESALKAAGGGQIYLDGLCIRAEWRKVASRTQDSRDFDARGGNLTSSRDLIRRGGKDRKQKRSRSRSRSRDRKRKRSRSRSRSGDRKKGRDRSRKNSRDRKKSRSRSDNKDKRKLPRTSNFSGTMMHPGILGNQSANQASTATPAPENNPEEEEDQPEGW